MTVTLGLLAGEASGDNLGAGLMQALIERSTQPIEFVGVGGPRMQALGLDVLAPMDRLAVNGFKDPILRLPELFRLMSQLKQAFLQRPVDAFVGVDFNVFNFLLESALKKKGIKTAHYVSPSVYAWRKGRTKRVAKSADLLLCLYPFEPQFYADTTVQAEFVGHPLADEIDMQASSPAARGAARAQLGLNAEDTVLAMLPGSRNSEVDLMISHFMAAAEIFVARQAPAHVVVPCLRPEIRARMEAVLRTRSDLPVTLYDGNARAALTACDIALVKSGTSTLEAMLLHRPMVVSYRLGPVSYQLVKRLVRTPYIALPNILAGRELVPELLQHDGTGQALAAALDQQLAAARQSGGLVTPFLELHEQLQQGADAKAAAAVLGLLERVNHGL